MERLKGVDPLLVAVVRRAIQITKVDFVVVEGLRTREQAIINYRKGRTAAELKAAGIKDGPLPGPKVTWTLKSKHIEGRAVDLAPWVDGKIDWSDLSKFDIIYHAMMQAAAENKVRLRYGGDWDMDGRLRERGEADSPHFELA
jgi:peptidoglycan L-alanyl-D-glutamate endopeptidase CwlK